VERHRAAALNAIVGLAWFTNSGLLSFCVILVFFTEKELYTELCFNCLPQPGGYERFSFRSEDYRLFKTLEVAYVHGPWVVRPGMKHASSLLGTWENRQLPFALWMLENMETAKRPWKARIHCSLGVMHALRFISKSDVSTCTIIVVGVLQQGKLALRK
jgi:hypothetical protein